MEEAGFAETGRGLWVCVRLTVCRSLQRRFDLQCLVLVHCAFVTHTAPPAGRSHLQDTQRPLQDAHTSRTHTAPPAGHTQRPLQDAHTHTAPPAGHSHFQDTHSTPCRTHRAPPPGHTHTHSASSRTHTAPPVEVVMEGRSQLESRSLMCLSHKSEKIIAEIWKKGLGILSSVPNAGDTKHKSNRDFFLRSAGGALLMLHSNQALAKSHTGEYLKITSCTM